MKGERITIKKGLGELKTCTFYLPEKVHMSVKVAAARRGIPMSQIMIDALLLYFEQKRPE